MRLIVRDDAVARQVWPRVHRHQTRRLLYADMESGQRGPFCFGSHSNAISGNWLDRSFLPGSTALPVHTGQPQPVPVRALIRACHSWPCSQRHQTFRLLPLLTSDGVRPPLRTGSHSARSVVSRSCPQYSFNVRRHPPCPYHTGQNSHFVLLNAGNFLCNSKIHYLHTITIPQYFLIFKHNMF